MAGVIFAAVDEVNQQLRRAQRLEKSPATVISGEGGRLDSLGLVNLIAVAFVTEFAWDAKNHRLGGSPLVSIAAMWGVAIVSWWLAGVTAPLATDNRPRMPVPLEEIES